MGALPVSKLSLLPLSQLVRTGTIPKSSQSSIMITLNRVHSNRNQDSQPDSNPSDNLHFHTCLPEYLLV